MLQNSWRLLVRLATAIAVLLVAGVALVDLASERTLNARCPVPPSAIRTPDDPVSIARGRHLFTTVSGCACAMALTAAARYIPRAHSWA